MFPLAACTPASQHLVQRVMALISLLCAQVSMNSCLQGSTCDTAVKYPSAAAAQYQDTVPSQQEFLTVDLTTERLAGCSVPHGTPGPIVCNVYVFVEVDGLDCPSGVDCTPRVLQGLFTSMSVVPVLCCMLLACCAELS